MLKLPYKEANLASLGLSNHMEGEVSTNIQHVDETILDYAASVQLPADCHHNE